MGELFDGRLRTDEGRREHNEGVFPFLGRSARPSSGEVRWLLEDWLSRVPEGDDRSQLRGALASRKDDESFESGFWGLYLHEVYRRSGYTVTIHPTCPASAPTRTSWSKATAAGSTLRQYGPGPAPRAADRRSASRTCAPSCAPSARGSSSSQ